MNRQTYLKRHRFQPAVDFDASARSLQGHGMVGREFVRSLAKYARNTLTVGTAYPQNRASFSRLSRIGAEINRWGLLIEPYNASLGAAPFDLNAAGWTKTDVVVTSGKPTMYDSDIGFWIEQDSIGGPASYLGHAALFNPADNKYRIVMDLMAENAVHNCRIEIGNGVDDTEYWDVSLFPNEWTHFAENHTFNSTTGLFYIRIYPDYTNVLPAGHADRIVIFAPTVSQAKYDGMSFFGAAEKALIAMDQRNQFRGDQGTLLVWLRLMFTVADPLDYAVRNFFSITNWDDADGYLKVWGEEDDLKIATSNESGTQSNTIAGLLGVAPATALSTIAVWDATGLSLYINGVKYINQASCFPGLVAPAAAKLEYGDYSGINQAEVLFHKVQYFPYRMSQNEILMRYNREKNLYS